MDLLPLNWYVQQPIDYEHKQYVLLAYLTQVDNFFINKVLSPHLLHMEKVINEMIKMKENFCEMDTMLKRKEYIYFIGDMPEKNDEVIIEIKKIISFAVPQIKTRIDFGYDILKNNNQVLF